MHDDIDTDVLVIGGGGSGLAAAIGAAEAGARVTVIEKNAELGGTTRHSIGSITATGTPHQIRAGIVDSPSDHFEDMALFAGPLAAGDNTDLRRVLVENVPDTFRWLMSLGLTFYGPMPEPPHRRPRMHNVLPNSRAYPFVLGRRCRRLGVEIRGMTRALSFLSDGGRVVGVLAEDPQGKRRFKARRGVVLASGDYSASPELKARFAPALTAIDAINPASTGDGQVMCEQLGCSIIHGERISGPKLRFVAPPTTHWVYRLPPTRLLTAPMAAALKRLPEAVLRPLILSFVTTFLAPEPMMLREGAILVNRNGERFADEWNAPQWRLAEQPGGEAFLVFDAALARKFSAWPYFVSTAPGVAYAFVDDYKRTRPDLYREAPTISALAEALKLSKATFEDTIVRFNRDGRVPQDGQRPLIGEPPFAALGPVKAWTILTDGGVGVTAEHEVLHRDGGIIPGLYAAGSAGQGGLLLEGHGHHLAWAFTSGRRAGRRAAWFRAP